MRIDSQNALDAYNILNVGAVGATEARTSRKLQDAYSSAERYRRSGVDVVVSYESRQSGSTSGRAGAEASGDYSRILKNSSTLSTQASATASALVAADSASSAQASAQPMRTDQTGKVNKVEHEYGLTSRAGNTQASSFRSTFQISA